MPDDDLHPGTRVRLHSLKGRAELNDLTGTLHEFVSVSGRWAVILDDNRQARGGGILLKPDNLELAPDRADAARALCELLTAQHPEKGFLVHDGIRFDESAGDVCVRATRSMEKGEILLVVPESAMVAVSSATCGAVKLGGDARSMRSILDAVARAFDEHCPDGLPMLEAHNVVLAVLLMHVQPQGSKHSAPQHTLHACACACGHLSVHAHTSALALFTVVWLLYACVRQARGVPPDRAAAQGHSSDVADRSGDAHTARVLRRGAAPTPGGHLAARRRACAAAGRGDGLCERRVAHDWGRCCHRALLRPAG